MTGLYVVLNGMSLFVNIISISFTQEEEARNSTETQLYSSIEQRLQEEYLSKPVCDRWNTTRDGEDIVELLLDAAADAFERNVTMGDWVRNTLKVGMVFIALPSTYSY